MIILGIKEPIGDFFDKWFGPEFQDSEITKHPAKIVLGSGQGRTKSKCSYAAY